MPSDSDSEQVVFAGRGQPQKPPPAAFAFLRPPPSEQVRKQVAAERKKLMEKAGKDAGILRSAGISKSKAALPPGCTFGSGGRIAKLQLKPSKAAEGSTGGGTAAGSATGIADGGNGVGAVPARPGAEAVRNDRPPSDGLFHAKPTA